MAQGDRLAMAKKKLIQEMTPALEKRCALMRDKWVNLGLSCEPMNRELAREGIVQAYKTAGLEEPKLFVWLESPLGGVLGVEVTKKILEEIKKPINFSSVGASVWTSVGASVGASVRASVCDSVWASVRDSVEDSVEDSVWASVGASVCDSVWDSVCDSVEDSVWASVGASVGASVCDSVCDSVEDSVWASVGASVGASVCDSVWASVRASVGENINTSISNLYDSHWIAFYETFEEELPDKIKHLEGIKKAISNCGWFLCFKGIVFVCNRPSAIHRDDRGRLHNVNGPAVSYRDGWGIYAYRGVRLPAHVIEEKDKINSASIQAESNQEIRRCMIEIIGGERFVQELKAKRVNEDRFGVLYKKEVDGSTLAYARLVNSTPEPDGSNKIYWLRVDPRSKTCREAVGRSFLGDRWKEYQPEVET